MITVINSTTEKNPIQRGTPNSIIIHTTGMGVGLKRIINSNSNDLIGPKYAERLAKVLPYKGHFLIDWYGMVYQFMPLNIAAYHASGNFEQLKRAKTQEWWRARWPDKKNPTEFSCWERRAEQSKRCSIPNFNSIGIDLLANPQGGYTEKQYDGLVNLLMDLNITGRDNIIGHEDMDPINRPGWDPGNRFDWNRLSIFW